MAISNTTRTEVLNAVISTVKQSVFYTDALTKLRDDKEVVHSRSEVTFVENRPVLMSGSPGGETLASYSVY